VCLCRCCVALCVVGFDISGDRVVGERVSTVPMFVACRALRTVGHFFSALFKESDAYEITMLSVCVPTNNNF
jgi:hypothetical protein